MVQHPEHTSAAPAESAQLRAAALIQAVEDAYQPAPPVPTAYRDDTPLPTVGSGVSSR